jgi:hypothetical protein
VNSHNRPSTDVPSSRRLRRDAELGRRESRVTCRWALSRYPVDSSVVNDMAVNDMTAVVKVAPLSATSRRRCRWRATSAWSAERILDRFRVRPLSWHKVFRFG